METMSHHRFAEHPSEISHYASPRPKPKLARALYHLAPSYSPTSPFPSLPHYAAHTKNYFFQFGKYAQLFAQSNLFHFLSERLSLRAPSVFLHSKNGSRSLYFCLKLFDSGLWCKGTISSKEAGARSGLFLTFLASWHGPGFQEVLRQYALSQYELVNDDLSQGFSPMSPLPISSSVKSWILTRCSPRPFLETKGEKC